MSHLTALVVDDIEEHRHFFKTHLEELGISVLCAANGSEALALVQKYPIQVIFMDYNMPEMNGFQVIHRLNQYFSSITMPFVVMISTDMRINQRAVAERKAQAFVPKACDKETLRHTMLELGLL